MHKKIFLTTFTAFVSFILLSLTPIISAQQGLVAPVQIDVQLRVGPGTEWRTLGIQPAGTNIALEGRDSTGAWVRGITQNSQVGWVAARFLAITPEAVFALPVVEREAPITVPVPSPGTVPASPPPAEQPAAQAPAQAAPGEGILTSASSNVNMRAGPATSFRRIGGVRTGQPLNVDGRDTRGAWVRGININGQVGWVSAGLTRLNRDQLLSLPVVDVNTPFNLAAPAGGTPATAAVDVQPIVSTAAVRGFALGGHVSGFGENAINAMRRAGMTWVKKQVRYFQGGNPGDIAGIINDAHAKGFRILLGVVGLTNEVNNPGYNDAYASYVAGLAALGADGIEVWNEPNIDREWPAGQIDPAAYTRLLASAYNAIKGANPNTLVVSGAPAPTGFFGGCGPFGCDDAPFIAGMAAAGAANFMDCVGIHYNEGIVPPTQNSGDPRSEYFTRYYQGMVRTYYNAFGGRRPLCFTELGYLTGEGIGPLPPAFGWAVNVTVAQQASWLGQVARIARGSGIVRLLIIWNVDFTNYGDDPMAGYAIIRPDGSCPACDAMR